VLPDRVGEAREERGPVVLPGNPEEGVDVGVVSEVKLRLQVVAELRYLLEGPSQGEQELVPLVVEVVATGFFLVPGRSSMRPSRSKYDVPGPTSFEHQRLRLPHPNCAPGYRFIHLVRRWNTKPTRSIPGPLRALVTKFMDRDRFRAHEFADFPARRQYNAPQGDSLPDV